VDGSWLGNLWCCCFRCSDLFLNQAAARNGRRCGEQVDFTTDGQELGPPCAVRSLSFFLAGPCFVLQLLDNSSQECTSRAPIPLPTMQQNLFRR
jgi:hypothetical protein